MTQCPHQCLSLLAFSLAPKCLFFWKRVLPLVRWFSPSLLPVQARTRASLMGFPASPGPLRQWVGSSCPPSSRQEHLHSQECTENEAGLPQRLELGAGTSPDLQDVAREQAGMVTQHPSQQPCPARGPQCVPGCPVRRCPGPAPGCYSLSVDRPAL